MTKEPKNRLISADKVEGTTVYSPDGDQVGSISNIMIDKLSGKVAYAVMSSGGGGIALPWNALSYDVEKDGYVVDVDRTRLVEAPQMAVDDLSQLENREYEKHIHDYYNIDPYWTFAG